MMTRTDAQMWATGVFILKPGEFFRSAAQCSCQSKESLHFREETTSRSARSALYLSTFSLTCIKSRPLPLPLQSAQEAGLRERVLPLHLRNPVPIVAAHSQCPYRYFFSCSYDFCFKRASDCQMRAMQRVEVDVRKLGSGSVAAINGKPFSKEASQRWLYRKASWIWKLIILVVLGLSGMYICISGVEKRVLYHKRAFAMAPGNKAETRSPCFHSKTSVAENFSVHYPEPLTFDRKDCSCTPVHYFVVFSMQRSGSGWFETLLNSHPNVSSHGEVFSVDGRRASVSAIKKTLDTIYNLDWVSSASKNDCTMAVGLKWMLNQGVMEYQPEIAAYLKEKSVSVIFLFRRNILRRYVSILANSFDRDAKQLNGTHRAHVHSEQEAKVLAAFKPVVNLTSLLPYLQRVEDIISDARISFKQRRHMTIYYEDLVANPQKELRKAQKFLGVKLKKLESKHVKIHTDPLNDQIDNWGDLSEFLKGTRYEMLLKGKDYG